MKRVVYATFGSQIDAKEKTIKMDETKNLIGKRFGMLTVLENSGKRQGHSVLWNYRCDCGGETLAAWLQLISEGTESCGCVPKIYASKK